MPQIRGQQILDGSVQRTDLDVTTAGSAVIRKVLAGTNISLVSTGPDAGTGDVTISATQTSNCQGVASGKILTNLASAAATTTVVVAANTLYALPFMIDCSATFTGIIWEVTTGVSSFIRTTLYSSLDSTNSYPGNVLNGTNALAATSNTPAGLKSNTFGTPVAVPNSLYWLSILADVNTTVRAVAGTASPPLPMENASPFVVPNIISIARPYANGIPNSFPSGATRAYQASYPIFGLLAQ